MRCEWKNWRDRHECWNSFVYKMLMIYYLVYRWHSGFNELRKYFKRRLLRRPRRVSNQTKITSHKTWKVFLSVTTLSILWTWTESSTVYPIYNTQKCATYRAATNKEQPKGRLVTCTKYFWKERRLEKLREGFFSVCTKAYMYVTVPCSRLNS